ncbi:MAG: hypothetical protein ACREEM_19085 [Blastocatellia bacterium]
MSFQFLIKNAGCFRQADTWYVDGELLSGNLSKETPAIALADVGELPVFIRNVSFVDPPIQNERFFMLVIDKPDYDVEWLKGATMIEDLEEQEHESELQLAIHQ